MCQYVFFCRQRVGLVVQMSRVSAVTASFPCRHFQLPFGRRRGSRCVLLALHCIDNSLQNHNSQRRRRHCCCCCCCCCQNQSVLNSSPTSCPCLLLRKHSCSLRPVERSKLRQLLISAISPNVVHRYELILSATTLSYLVDTGEFISSHGVIERFFAQSNYVRARHRPLKIF